MVFQKSVQLDIDIKENKTDYVRRHTMQNYELGDIIEMKKPHACVIKATNKKANAWEVIRMGADIKIQCTNCQHIVMLPRREFNRKMKKIIEKNS